MTIKEYDDQGNLVHYKDSEGFELWREFNSRGSNTHYKDSSGAETVWEYNENGKLISKKEVFA